MISTRKLAVVTVLTVVAAACGNDAAIFPATSMGDIAADADELTTSAVAPEFLVIDEDPASPVSLTIGFADNDDGLASLVILGDKLPTSRPPEGMLVYFEDEVEPFVIDFDSQGRLAQVLAPDGAEARVLSYQQNEAMVIIVDPDGREEVVTVEVPEVDLTAFDGLAVSSEVNAVPAIYRADKGVPPLAAVVATATGSYSVNTPGTVSALDVLLRAGECAVSPIPSAPATSGRTPVACSVSIGADAIVVRSSVNVQALYQGQIPAIFFETQQECDAGGTASTGAGLLLLAGGVLALAVTGVAVVAVTSLAGLVTVLGVGSVSAFSATAMGGTLIHIGGQPCTGAFTTNEGLRRDVEERLQGVTATVGYFPTLLKDPELYTVEADPDHLVFEPFGGAGSGRLDPVTVSVVPKDAIDAPSSTTTIVQAEEPFPWTYEGTYRTHSIYRLDFGAADSIENDNELRVTITLFADGTVGGALAAARLTGVGPDCSTDPPPGTLWTYEADSEEKQITGSHSDGTIRFVFFPGQLDVEGEYTATRLHAQYELGQEMTACSDFPEAGNLLIDGSAAFLLERISPPAP